MTCTLILHCYLPICLFTGGSSDGRAAAKRGKTERPPGSCTSSRVPIKPRTTSDQPSTVSGSGMSTGQKRKKGKDLAPVDDAEEQVPEHNTATVHIAAWRRYRDTNPYRFKERTSTDDDRLF